MKRLLAALAASALLAGQAFGADEPKKDDKPAATSPSRHGEEGHQGRARFLRGGEQPFWIGAMCMPADEILRAQLNLDHGALVVGHVMPDSPAAKAGLKEHDVIVKAGDREATDLGALVAAVNEAGEKELKLEILRGGKKQTLAVTPTKRPAMDAPFFQGGGFGPQGPQPWQEQFQRQMDQALKNLPQGEEGRRLREWLEKNRRGDGDPLRMHMFGPGVVMQQEGAGLPAGVSVSITKQGSEPSKIHVQRGDEKWDVTEGELDKLPQDLRGPVANMLGRAATGGGIVVGPSGVVVQPGVPGGDAKVDIQPNPRGGNMNSVFIGPNPGDPLRGQMLEEMQKMRRDLESLQKRVDELQKSQGSKPNRI